MNALRNISFPYRSLNDSLCFIGLWIFYPAYQLAPSQCHGQRTLLLEMQCLVRVMFPIYAVDQTYSMLYMSWIYTYAFELKFLRITRGGKIRKYRFRKGRVFCKAEGFASGMFPCKQRVGFTSTQQGSCCELCSTLCCTNLHKLLLLFPFRLYNIYSIYK